MLCVALAVGACRAGALDPSAKNAGTRLGVDGGGAIGGSACPGASADAGSPSEIDGGAGAGGAPSTTTAACSPPDAQAPRLLSPLSGSTVTSARPSLRWTGGTGPYILQICVDRACDDVRVVVDSDGAETTLPQDLRPGYWFWRVRGSGPDWTPSWEMRVRRRFPGYAPAANSAVGGFSDYDGDGYPDAAALGAAPMAYLGGPRGLSPSRVLPTDPNGGLGTLLMEPQVDVTGDGLTDLGSEEQIGLGDFDGDGFGDLVVQSRYGAAMIHGCASMPPDSFACGACQLQQVATGDFDGDGRTDVIYADNSRITLYMGNPNKPTPIAIPGTSGLWVVDFNYDGYSDLVIDDQSPAGTLRAYEGGPGGLSSTLSTAAQPTVFVLVGDFDGDGYWDTIGPDCRNGCSVAYGGPGGWGAPATRTTPLDVSIIVVGPGYTPDAIVVDLNRDGYDDLLVSKPGGTAISWYAGSPDGLSAAADVILSP